MKYLTFIIPVSNAFLLQKQALPCILSNPCQNGATCANDYTGGYTCACASGYTGTTCQYGNDLFFVFVRVYFRFILKLKSI